MSRSNMIQIQGGDGSILFNESPASERSVTLRLVGEETTEAARPDDNMDV
jgi:hypothetical protein